MDDLWYRPDRRAQPDGGAALERLHRGMSRMVGEHIGGLIAEQNTIDEPFCRQLARATDPAAQPAKRIVMARVGVSYTYVLDGEDPVFVKVKLMDNLAGDVGAEWDHPAPRTPRAI